MDKSWIDQLKFKDDGLMPAVIQDYANGQVLMVGYMNKEAVKLTLESGLVHFYSRSRQKMWKKGEISGHIQKVREILLDCDEDTLLIKIEQECASCHKGYRTCFYRKVNSDGSLETIEKKIFEPKDIYLRTSPDVASGRCGVSPSKKKNLDWGGFTNNGIDTRNVEGY